MRQLEITYTKPMFKLEPVVVREDQERTILIKFDEDLHGICTIKVTKEALEDIVGLLNSYEGTSAQFTRETT